MMGEAKMLSDQDLEDYRAICTDVINGHLTSTSQVMAGRGLKLLAHIEAIKAEQVEALKEAIDSVISADAVGQDLEALAVKQNDRITELEKQVADLKAEMQFDTKEQRERLNQFWGLVYPGDPTSWEYPAQVWRHVRDQRDELRQRIMSLEAAQKSS